MLQQLLFGGLGFIIWAITVISTYYSTSYSSVSHIETSTWYGWYLGTMIALYLSYKFISIAFDIKTLRFNALKIGGIFLLHLLILCGFYTNFPEVIWSPLMNGIQPSSLVLFWHILELLAYPILLVILTRDVGYSIFSWIVWQWKEYDLRIRFGAEVTLGFFIFSSLLVLLGVMGMYTLTGLYSILGLLAIVGIPGHIMTWNDLKKRTVELENHSMNSGVDKMINLKLLSIELGIFFIFFLISISLINAIRPMPIGWDDLGVYMNFPKLMATSGEILKGAGMFSWQIITGTGFLFSYTAAQAFYVNQLGWILVVIAIICSLSYLLEEKNKKYLLSLPVIFAAVFYAMPMNIFQQAKDMKLDPALLFFSISSFSLIYSYWKQWDFNKNNLKVVLIAGILIGFCFSVKITSLLLILWVLGLIAYRILSIEWYVWFFALFLAIFTKFNLWSNLNVWIPKDNPNLINSISLSLVIIGIIALLIWAFKKNGIQKIQEWIILSLIFWIGVGIGVAPWILKNYTESWNTGMFLLNGSGGTFSPNFSKIYNPEELKEKEDISKGSSITSNGQSMNEDLWRYFGYEKGLNNYLKLPANLTFQKNQSGEFTDITFIFLALLPVSLLFIRGRKNIFPWIIAIITIAMFCYYFYKTASISIGSFFEHSFFELPSGYLIMILANILFIWWIHFLLEKNETNRKIQEFTVFLGTYGFLFMICTFGIVWYGIFIYFCFFALISLSINTFNSYDALEAEKNDDIFGTKLVLAIIFLLLIWTYFVRSAFPHGWNNLKAAYYNEYKYNTLSQEESIFAYRNDYITPIAALNLKDTSIFNHLDTIVESKNLKDLLGKNADSISLTDLHSLILKLRLQKTDPILRKDAKMLGEYIYKNILYPNKSEANTGNIYRIGTFMTYLIINNRERYFEDSLISSFKTYFYDPSPEVTINRMRKIGLKYLLVDLNAATIDRDPRHDLTDRFEKLLLTMRSKDLTLIDTDNFCLELAVDEYKKWKLQTPQEFINLAGTNYESYTASGWVIGRGQKLANCHQYIVNIINSGETNLPPVIEAIKSEIIQQDAAKDSAKLIKILSKYVGQSWFVLFEINDTPAPQTKDSVTQTESASTGTVMIQTGTTTKTGSTQKK